MESIGQRLRNARESRGLKRVDIAKATKVGAHHLAALEHDDFDALPDAVYAKGYVRTYAEHLGLDVESVVADFTRELEARRPAPAEDTEEDVVREMSRMLNAAEDGRVAKRRAALTYGVWATVIILGAFTWWWLISGRPEEPSAQSLVRNSAENRVPEDLPPARVDLPASTGAASEETRGSKPPLEEDEVPGFPEVETRVENAVDDLPDDGIPVDPQLDPVAESTESVPGTDTRAEPSVVNEPDSVTTMRTVEQPVDAAPPRPEPAINLVVETQVAAGGVTIEEFGVGTGIEDRRLVGEADRFVEGTRIWFWTRVRGGTRGERIRHVWIHEGREMNSVELELGGEHWRTHSRKTLYGGSAGRWAVEARDPSGRVLARREFLCTSG